jgi:CRP-like cAMP-binding protein
MNTAHMLRKARKAASIGDYVTASRLYADLSDLPGIENRLDVTLRFAYCSEKSGDFPHALSAYKQVLDEYWRQGEAGAARAIEEIIKKVAVRSFEEFRTWSEDSKSEQEMSDGAEVLGRLMRTGGIRHLKPGEVLCRYGDQPSHLWLLTSGKLEVRVPDYEDTDILEGEYDTPYLLGELGYFTGQRRAATLVAITNVHVIELPADGIREMCAGDKALAAGLDRLFRELLVERILSRHAVFERINDMDRKRLALAFDCLKMGPGEVIVREGEERDGAFLLQSGCLFLMPPEHDRGAKEKQGEEYITSAFPGDIVHLGGLLDGYKSPCRVVTATAVELLHLPRKIFEPYAAQRPWIVPAILRQSRKPPHQQVMRPDEDYMWHVDRKISLTQAASRMNQSMEAK